jgi:hypothetical protein
MAQSNDPILSYLQKSKELPVFCSQNGWIINESIFYEVLQSNQNSVLIYTTFLESIMEGSGCQCDQKSCYGRMQLTLDDAGEVLSALVV